MPLRQVEVFNLFISDEEIGGDNGMRVFVNTKEFKALNIGFSIDEGIASPTEEFFLFYEERAIWRKYPVISSIVTRNWEYLLLLSNSEFCRPKYHLPRNHRTRLHALR